MKIADTYLYKIYHIQKKLYYTVNQDIKMPITHDNFMTLRHIYENPGITQTDLATINDKDRNVIGRLIDKLESLNYVQRVRSEGDRRIFKLYITDEGTKFVDLYWDDIIKRQEDCLCNLNDDEKETLKSLLNKILL